MASLIWRESVARLVEVGATMLAGDSRGVLAKLDVPLDPDPLGEVIAGAIAEGRSRRRPRQEDRLEARHIRDRARATEDYARAIADATEFVGRYPRVEEFQKIVARLYQESRDERALAAWLGVTCRFPMAMDAFHSFLVVVHRRHGATVAAAVLKARFPRVPRRMDQLLVYAEACDLVGATSSRRAAFARLARKFAKRREAWLIALSWLEEEVGINRRAVSFLKWFAAGAGLVPPVSFRQPSFAPALTTSRRAPGKSQAPSSRALATLFDRVLDEREALHATRTEEAGPILLLTGSLGAGGAERQLVNTAIGLSRLSLQDRTLRTGPALDGITVVARSLRDRKDGTFYLADLRNAGIDVHSYREWPDFGGDLATSAVQSALQALGHLPWSMAEAVIKLTDGLRAQRPAVVHIWQDGLVYAAGLAAVLAHVPRIVLSGRSTPPPDRRQNYLPEYDVIYRSLLRAPGVSLSVNSYYAASRYAAWLDLNPERISVIPNGVAAPAAEGDADAVASYREFGARTAGSTFTLGAVMRLDEVKRPVEWIEAAAVLLGKVPGARCVIVGDGPFRPKVERRAEALGISGRCLFAGRSSCVGFWLSKMDMLMLLSAHEGLPNALIEAQLSGVPVITTPAGGAPETVVEGTTGFVTRPNPSAVEVADLIERVILEPNRLRQMGDAARRWAEERFPMSRMLERTMEVYGASNPETAGLPRCQGTSGHGPAAVLGFASHDTT